MSNAAEDEEDYKQSSFCGFDREIFETLKKRSILCSSSSDQSSQSSPDSFLQNSFEDQLLLESLKQVEDTIEQESMSFETKTKQKKIDQVNIETITIDISDDEEGGLEEEDTIMLPPHSLVKTSHILESKPPTPLASVNDQCPGASKYVNNTSISTDMEISPFTSAMAASPFSSAMATSAFSSAMATSPFSSAMATSSTTSATSVSESYRQEILEVTKQIDELVTNSKPGKKTGLITLSCENFAKGRVKIVGQKWVAGELFKTSKHLGLFSEQAELKVVKEILKLLEAKYVPERNSPDESLERYEHDLLQFCKETNLSEPGFSCHLMEGKYHVTLAVGSQVSHSGPAKFMKDGRAMAAKNWLWLHGGNWQQVLDQKNCQDQSSGCLVFNWNHQKQSSQISDVDDVEIIPSPRLTQHTKQSTKIPNAVFSDQEKRSRELNLDDRDNSDVMILQRSPGKVKNSSQILTPAENDIFNLYSQENSKLKDDYSNSTKNKEPMAEVKFKFRKKKNGDTATSTWLSQEFPDPVLDDGAEVSSSQVYEAGDLGTAIGSRRFSKGTHCQDSSSEHKMKRPSENTTTNDFPVKTSRFFSPSLEVTDCYEQGDDSKEPSFKFSSHAIESSKSSKMKEPKKMKRKSNIFNYSDDPDVVEIIKREKAEAKKVASKAKKGSRYVKGVKKMMEFSQRMAESWKKNSKSSLNDCHDEDFESPVKRQKKRSNKDAKDLIGEPELKTTKLSQELETLEDSPYSLPLSPSMMVSPIFSRKVSVLEESEIEEDIDNDSNEYIPDLDELLKLPERPADGSKTKDEILDEFDQQIAEKQRLHDEEMAQVDADIEAEKQKRVDKKLRMKDNAKLRNRLETELTEPLIKKMFCDNVEYLGDIWRGKVESSRHQAFHKSIRTRHALYYKIITDPFTDDQLNWTMDEMERVWMSNIRDQMDNKEYVWKVLLSECFIKFYMDFFNFTKEEAMQRISESPLHKKDRLREFMNTSETSEDSQFTQSHEN